MYHHKTLQLISVAIKSVQSRKYFCTPSSASTQMSLQELRSENRTAHSLLLNKRLRGLFACVCLEDKNRVSAECLNMILGTNLPQIKGMTQQAPTTMRVHEEKVREDEGGEEGTMARWYEVTVIGAGRTVRTVLTGKQLGDALFSIEDDETIVTSIYEFYWLLKKSFYILKHHSQVSPIPYYLL